MLVIQSGIIRFVNAKALELFGYSGELTPRSFAELIHPEDRERVLAIYQKRLKGEGVPETYSFRIIGSQGKVKWLEIKAALISWKNEPATLIFFNDITERKRMEGALKESEEKYRLLVEKANEGICVVQDSNLQYVNPKLTEFLGYSEGELISRPFLDFIHPEGGWRSSHCGRHFGKEEIGGSTSASPEDGSDWYSGWRDCPRLQQYPGRHNGLYRARQLGCSRGI
jgi:PAS domain S-box-containing protein